MLHPVSGTDGERKTLALANVDMHDSNANVAGIAVATTSRRSPSAAIRKQQGRDLLH